LVDDDKAPITSVGADKLLQLDYLEHTLVNKLTFGGEQSFTLFRGGVEESSVDLAEINKKYRRNQLEKVYHELFNIFQRVLSYSRLLKLQRHVASKNKAVGELLRHVRVTSTMIQNQTFDETRSQLVTLLHLQDFHHVEVQSLCFRVQNGEDSVSTNLIKEKIK